MSLDVGRIKSKWSVDLIVLSGAGRNNKYTCTKAQVYIPISHFIKFHRKIRSLLFVAVIAETRLLAYKLSSVTSQNGR